MDKKLSKPLGFCKSVFIAAGIWWDGSQSWAYMAYGCFVQSFVLIMFTAFIFCYMVEAQSLVDFNDALGVAMANISQIFKTYFLIYKMREILKSLENLESLIEFSKSEKFPLREKVQKQTDRGYRVHFIFLCFGATTCTTAGIAGFLNRQLPYRIWFPFDTENSEIGFLAGSIYLIVGPFIVAATDLTLDMYPVIFMCFAMGLIDELADRLGEIGKPLEIEQLKALNFPEQKKLQKAHDREQMQELIHCVQVHNKIKSFVKEIENNFSKPIFVQGALSTVILCACAFVLATETDISRSARMLSFIIPMALEIFLPCYFGNELVLASKKLSGALFYSDWFNGDPKLKRGVQIFLENTKKDILITAFGIFDVNLDTFKRIGNSAYSLFAVLNRVYD